MDVMIVEKRMISFVAICGLLVALLIFVAGYFVGKSQTGPAKISIASFDQPAISESDPIPTAETEEERQRQEEEQVNAVPATEAPSEKQTAIDVITEEVDTPVKPNPSEVTSPNIAEDAREVESPKPETIAPEPKPSSKPQKGFALQVAAFGNQKNAERYLAKLVEKGYASAFIFEDNAAKNRLKFSVRIGFYSSYGVALQAANEFKVQEDKAAMIVNRTLMPKSPQPEPTATAPPSDQGSSTNN